MAKKTSSKPNGLAIARTNLKFACSWKKGETYEKQQFSYFIDRNGKTDKWSTASDIGRNTTSKSISVTAADFFPNSGKPKIVQVKFKVRGKAKDKEWSDWNEKAFTIAAPFKPSLTVTPNSTNYNQCTFTWEADTKTEHRPISDVEIQTKIVENYDYVDDKNWTKDTAGASGSRTYTETSSLVASGSHTRWFRVRSRGIGGVGEWKYGRRVYSAPYAPKNVKGQVTKQSGGLQTKVTWTEASNKPYPVDTTTAEYAMAVPDAGLTYTGSADGEICTLAGKGGAASAKYPVIASDHPLYVVL